MLHTRAKHMISGKVKITGIIIAAALILMTNVHASAYKPEVSDQASRPRIEGPDAVYTIVISFPIFTMWNLILNKRRKK
jgi:hypothetical protein